MKFGLLFLVTNLCVCWIGVPTTIGKRHEEEHGKIQLERRGIHLKLDRCSKMFEKCSLLQHCCDPFECARIPLLFGHGFCLKINKEKFEKIAKAKWEKFLKKIGI